MKTYEGQLTTSKDEKFCIIISRFNDFIGSKLLSGAIDELRRHGVDEENIITSMFIETLGVAKNITKVNRTSLLEIIDTKQFSTIVTPKSIL